MLKENEIDILKEKKDLSDNYKKSLKELRKLSSFLKAFVKINEEMGKILENINDDDNKENINDKQDEKENENENKQPLKIFNSFLSSNINNFYDSFNLFIKNSQNLIASLEVELVSPLDDFIENQKNFYNKNLNKMKKMNSNFQNNKIILDNSKKNYYLSSYISNKDDSKEIDNFIIRGENELNAKRDNLIKNKMIAKNDEFIYKYELAKYNKNVSNFNEEYDSLADNIVNLEKTKTHFIESLISKYKKYLLDYSRVINQFINQIEKFKINENDDKKEIDKNKKEENNELKKNVKASKIEFISYQNFCEINKKNKNKIESNERVIINPSLEINDKDTDIFIKDLVNNLLSENDVGQEKISKIFEYLNLSTYEIGKKLLNYLLEKRGISSIVFLNLQNLVYLSNVLGYITLHKSSIFDGQFDLNFKIIFIAERIFYLKKSTNDKIYLSALLSKNKYYRTKQFWGDFVELKLANKLADYIKRFKNLKYQEKSKGGIFRNFFKDSSKNYLLAKTRILPLLKEYTLLSQEHLELIDKIAIQEMQSIIRETIPSFANFNFPSEQSLDLIAQLTQEYKIDKVYMSFYVTYFNVSSYTIRKLIPNEKGNTMNIYNQFKTLTGINKKLKLFRNIVPFLTFSDYNNLLLCSKLFHKKLSKTIYKYLLKQKNLSNKIRLSIWQNLLGISELKKKYKYKEILSNANDEKVKHEIELDVIRTTIGEVENPQETREQITNVLYAVSQLNGKIKYCQGMNFVVQFLYEIYGEEEAFYIFLAFFKNTEYNLIFAKELEELKILFYVFKRVISLLEPELSSYFNSNGVDVNFFISPWFITLFTGSHQHFKGENDNSRILIRILDNFIVSGLKSIMEVGCVALHSYENILMNKRYEEMMQFLINDMLRSDFFSKKNIEFIESFFTNNISKKLVKNIEEEFKQEQKLSNIVKK